MRKIGAAVQLISCKTETRNLGLIDGKPTQHARADVTTHTNEIKRSALVLGDLKQLVRDFAIQIVRSKLSAQ